MDGTPAVHAHRVCIIGCVNVGTAGAYAIAQSRLICELVSIDADRDKAEGEKMDLRQATADDDGPARQGHQRRL